MSHRGRTASGGKVRVVMWGQRAAVGRVIVKPLLSKEGEWGPSVEIRARDVQRVSRRGWQTYS